MIDILNDRLVLAEAFEPDFLINASNTDPVVKVREITHGKGADVIITATPAPVAQVQAVEMARKGGRILLFGGLPKDKSRPGVDMNIVHYQALQLVGTTIFAPRHQRMALSLMVSGRIPLDRLVTHRFPLEDFEHGVAKAMEGQVLKAVFLTD
jgi:L-iditol 2-dehydrogenase